MEQISSLLELRVSNGRFRMGNMEVSGAEQTQSHFHAKGMGQPVWGQLQEARYCKFVFCIICRPKKN